MKKATSLSDLGALAGLNARVDERPACAVCGLPMEGCRCKPAAAASAASASAVRVGRETKGRGGKVVTLVRGLALPEAALGDLAKSLKTACGSGGAVKDGVIEIQGDHRDRVVDWLVKAGYPAKRAG